MKEKGPKNDPRLGEPIGDDPYISDHGLFSSEIAKSLNDPEASTDEHREALEAAYKEINCDHRN